MKTKAFFFNLVLVTVSSAVGLFLSEVAARLVLNPSDYLSVDMVGDGILGAIPSPNTIAGGFDAWGFRNVEVPNAAEVVAIGDSHTYGNTATMDDSWPYVLGRRSARRVYNMGLGGYGPNQYFHLVTTRALELKPAVILVGLYMGDDFENAYSITYGLDYWAYLRAIPSEKVNFDVWETPAAPRWHKRLRIWLSRHSVAYQLVFHGPLLGSLQGEFQIRNPQLLAGSVTSLSVPERNILEAFRPEGLVSRLDQGSDRVREGMRITFKLLGEMNAACQLNNVEFLVVVIPTKEMVFAQYLEHRPELALSDALDTLLANERVARDKTFEFLTDAKIRYVDTLPALRRSVGSELYARTAGDMHPNKNGYKVIADATFAALDQSTPH